MYSAYFRGAWNGEEFMVNMRLYWWRIRAEITHSLRGFHKAGFGLFGPPGVAVRCRWKESSLRFKGLGVPV